MKRDNGKKFSHKELAKWKQHNNKLNRQRNMFKIKKRNSNFDQNNYRQKKKF